MVELRLERDSFRNLVDAISILKDSCSDVDIVESRIRQTSTNRTILIDIDLDPVFSSDRKVSVPISNIKQKLELFKGLFKDSQEVVLTIDERVLEVSDSISKVSFLSPKREFLENTFIDSMDKLLEMDKMERVFEIQIPVFFCSRIMTINNSFNSTGVDILLKPDKLEFRSESLNKADSAVVFSVEATPLVPGFIEEGFVARVSDTPFSVPFTGDNVQCTVYSNNNNRFLFSFSGMIDKVPVSLYCMSFSSSIDSVEEDLSRNYVIED